MNYKTMLLKLRNYQFHILFWSIYIIYEITISWQISGKIAELPDQLVHYSFCMCLFYFNAHIVLKTRTKPSSLWLKPALVVAEVFISMMISFQIDRYLMDFGIQNPFLPFNLHLPYFLSLLWRILFFILFSTGYYFLLSSNEKTKEIKLLEESRLNDIIENQKIAHQLTLSQNAFLKAQINPHFLFNTLNYLYSETWKKAPEAAEGILILAGLMRYNLQSVNENGLVSLKDEIVHLESFLSLYQIRQSQKVYINLVYDQRTNEAEILPLLLVPLVENMFKHGDLHQEHMPGNINISYDNDFIKIETDNLKGYQSQLGYQIGINNIKERLRLIYGSRHTFVITEIDNRFKVEILINTH